jgi:serine/threonine-protein kinase RsbT
MNTARRIYINNDLDVVMARLQARELAKQMGFGTADQARISLAASELAKVLSWDTATPGEIVMADAAKNGLQGLKVSCLVKLEYLPPEEAQKPPENDPTPSRNIAGACQLVDESTVELLDDKKARITLLKWLK